MTIRFFAVLVGFGVFFGQADVSLAQALQVGGPAGQCTFLTFNGCYVGQNSCPYRVRLHLGNVSALINPGGSWTFNNFGGGCLKSYVGPTTANQE